MYEIDLEPEVEAWLLDLPYSHYQRVMRNADDYLVTGGVPDGDHVKKLQDANDVYELRVALDRTTWRISFWKPGGRVIILLTVFRKTREGTQKSRCGPRRPGEEGLPGRTRHDDHPPLRKERMMAGHSRWKTLQASRRWRPATLLSTASTSRQAGTCDWATSFAASAGAGTSPRRK